MNKTSENMTYLIDNKNVLCQHNKLDTLTDKRGKWILETMYRDIEYIIQHDSHKYITSGGEEYLSNQKLTTCKIDYELFC